MPNLPQGVRVVAGLGIGPEEIAYVRSFVRGFPGLSRHELTATVCEHLGWLTVAGQPKMGAATKVLAWLEEAGEVDVPALQSRYSHRGARRAVRAPTGPWMLPQRPVRCELPQLGPVRLRWAAGAEEQARWNEAMGRFHPLGYKKPFGYFARYFIEADEEWLGGLLLSGAAKALQGRDRWIGWDAQQRRRNLPWVINNNRFLIFPWVEVPHLASHVLGQLARRVADDWDSHWGFRPLLLETFVDPARFRGTCYRAAGWACLGHTTGEGLVRPGRHYQTTPKLIFAKPLQADFRRLLCSDLLPGRPLL